MKIKDSNKVVTLLRDPHGRGEHLPVIHRTLNEIKYRPDAEKRNHQSRNTHLSSYNTKNTFDPHGQTLADLEDIEKVYHNVRKALKIAPPDNSLNIAVTKKKQSKDPEEFAKNVDAYYSKLSRIKGNSSYIEMFGYDFNPDDEQTSGTILKCKEKLKDERDKKRNKRTFASQEENSPRERLHNQPFISFHETRALFKKDQRNQNQLKQILKNNQDNLKAVKANHFIMNYGEPENSTSFITSVQETSFLSNTHDESFQRHHLISLVDGSLLKPYTTLPSLKDKVNEKRDALKQQKDTEFQLKSDMQRLTKMLEEVTRKSKTKGNIQGDGLNKRSRSNMRRDTKFRGLGRFRSQEKTAKRSRLTSQAESEMDLEITDPSISSEKNSSRDSLSMIHALSKQVSTKRERASQELPNKNFDENVIKQPGIRIKEPESERSNSVKEKSIKKPGNPSAQKKAPGDENSMGTDRNSEHSQKTAEKRARPTMILRNQGLDPSLQGKLKSNSSHHRGSVMMETPTEIGSNNPKATEESMVLDGKATTKALETVLELSESKRVTVEDQEPNEIKVIRAANEFIRRRRDLNNSLEETLKVLGRDRPRSNKLRYDSYTPTNIQNSHLNPGDIRRIAENTRKQNYSALKQYSDWYLQLIELVIKNELLLEESHLQPSYIICDVIKEAIEDGEQPQKRHFYQIAGLLLNQGELNKTVRLLINELKIKFNIQEHELPYHLQF